MIRQLFGWVLYRKRALQVAALRSVLPATYYLVMATLIAWIIHKNGEAVLDQKQTLQVVLGGTIFIAASAFGPMYYAIAKRINKNHTDHTYLNQKTIRECLAIFKQVNMP